MEKQKIYVTIINLKYLLQHGMTDLNYLMDHILYQIFRINLSILKKNIYIDSPSITICINKTEN